MTKWTQLSALSITLSLAACGGDESIAGQNCVADTDCGVAGHCVGAPHGVCSVPSSTGACSANGSRAECPGGSRCWKTLGGEYYCFADCNATCGGNGGCDSDGVCVPMSELPANGSGTSCSCVCRCSGYTADVDRTCSGGGSACASCSVVCEDTCGYGYIGYSGSCS
jgi:hypothetical protein